MCRLRVGRQLANTCRWDHKVQDYCCSHKQEEKKFSKSFFLLVYDYSGKPELYDPTDTCWPTVG